MSVIRSAKDRENPYVQINKKLLEDPSLSLKAKGFIAYCLSKPDNWTFYINQLTNVLKEGERALYSALQECIELGYAFRWQPKKANGDFDTFETIVSDSKEEIIRRKHEFESEIQKSLTVRRFADAQVADAQNSRLIINEERENDLKETDKRRSPKSVSEKSENIDYVTKPSTSSFDSLSPAAGSFPSFQEDQKGNSFEIDDPDVAAVLNLEEKYKPHIPPEEVITWMKKYGPRVVFETLRLFLENIAKKKPIKKPRAWIQAALDKNYIQKQIFAQKNKTLAEKMKNTLQWHSLEIKSRYCVDTRTQKDYSYNRPCDEFKRSLVEAHKSLMRNPK